MTDPAPLDIRSGVAAPPEPLPTDEAHFEIIDGRRVEMPPMSAYSAKIATRLVSRLNGYLAENPLGEAVMETLFRLPLAGGRTRNRRPDVAFVSYQRWPADRPQDPDANAWDVVPDLAVEVISPNDLAEEQRDKVLEYFGARSRLTWVVYPKHRLVDVFEAPGRVRILNEADALDGGDVVPGFRLPLSNLFGPTAPDRAGA